MTERKPKDMSFEGFVERQIREAQERGEFENLPGAGKPLAGLDQPYDEMWWVRDLMRREQLSVLPPALELKREIERGLEEAMRLGSEGRVRHLVKLLNHKIIQANKTAMQGPATSLGILDADAVVARWRRQRAASG
jgi:hypothetical protein